MSIIIINATAAKTSGALTILKDCMTYIESNPSKDKEYHLFTVVDDFDVLRNVQVHKLQVQNWFSRIQWDNGGLQKWCRKHSIEPDAIISLQNTSTKYKNRNGLMIVQVVYYHQTIPLFKRNGLDESLRMAMYRYFYPFFVNRNNEITHYVVQLPCIKKLFCERFKNIPSDRVTVVRSGKPRIDVNTVVGKTFSEKKVFRFLYPATPLNYKNHAVLVWALAKLKKNNPNAIGNIILYFTIDELPEHLMKDIVSNGLESSIRFIGQVPYAELLSYYKSVDILLFPSKLESLGLPLLEASCFGLPIIAADLSYAREVLQGYKNAYYAITDSVDDWAEALSNYRNYGKLSHDDATVPENTWKDFFTLTDKLILERNNV